MSWAVLGLVITLLPLAARAAQPELAPSSTYSEFEPPELAYLKTVNTWRPPADPQLLFLLMQQFASAGKEAEGIAFFEERVRLFGPTLKPAQRAQYLTAIALLRANHAQAVSIFSRLGWVRDTLAMLDEANRITNDQMFVSRWMSGVIRTRIPRFLGERDHALADLLWCLHHPQSAPQLGWLRTVYRSLGQIYRDRNELTLAEKYSALAGPEDMYDAIFTTPFALNPINGHTFSARRITEVIPGTVYALSGFEFTEFYFVVSADRRELIAIDVGTRVDSAEAAYESLRAHAPGLPPLTTVFVTHAHWDHVGGYRYFRNLGARVRFYGRGNFQEELANDAKGSLTVAKHFFGESFRLEDVMAYRPDVTVDHETALTIGGTRFELLPVSGGETPDALLIHMPDQGVTFVGDVLMPYFGAPFTNEGSVEGALAVIDVLHNLNPKVLLHGHEPLTRLFRSTQILDELKPKLAWLRDEVLVAMKDGKERASIQQSNLIPPSLSDSSSEVQLAYLVMRENLINRVFEQNSGYWQNGLQGLDVLTVADYGAALQYLHLSDEQVAAAAERMMSNGRHEGAAALLRWAASAYPNSELIRKARAHAYLNLMAKFQEFNPFKFIMYGSQIGETVPQMSLPETASVGNDAVRLCTSITG